MPWPRLNTKGRVPQQVENFAHPPLKMRSAGKQEQRIEIALHRQAALQVLPHEGERHAGVAADGVDAGPMRVGLSQWAASTRKSDDRYGGSRCLHPGYDGASRQYAPAGELVFGQAAGPAVENLEHAGASLHLAEQIGDRGLHQEIDEALEGGGVAIGPEPCFAPGPCCRRPRPCRSPRSTAPRKSRSPERHPAAPAPRGPRSHRPGQIGLRPRPGRAAPDPCRSAPARASGPSPSTNSTFCPRA